MHFGFDLPTWGADPVVQPTAGTGIAASTAAAVSPTTPGPWATGYVFPTANVAAAGDWLGANRWILLAAGGALAALGAWLVFKPRSKRRRRRR